MKKIFYIVLFQITISNFSFSQKILTIEINEIKNNTGNIMLQVFDEKEKIIARDMSSIKDRKCIFSIKILTPGKYAVRYYHDENMSMEMEKNRFGKPLEGYGFSNNVTAPFSMPPFEKWLFEIDKDIKISLKPTY